MVDCWKGTVEMETDSMGRVTPKSQINTWTPRPSLSRECCPPCVFSSSIFHPSIINPPRTPPTDLVGSPVFVRQAPRELCASVCVSLWARKRVCVSGLLISLGCCRFKLFIPTAPAHIHTHAHLHHMPARIRPPERRSPWQPYQRSQISAREMK